MFVFILSFIICLTLATPTAAGAEDLVGYDLFLLVKHSNPFSKFSLIFRYTRVHLVEAILKRRNHL